ncbi:hypothetical protein A0H81_08544 [Grifola frondosa]|uniref:Uncharacterized protein n=1 Tax=Grifola frondosa TaxID=5627 RepID=A0A1C7M4R3_GRIFR|nr:hypothetical protein A0H81_08544 [Grifola frondosa]
MGYTVMMSWISDSRSIRPSLKLSAKTYPFRPYIPYPPSAMSNSMLSSFSSTLRILLNTPMVPPEPKPETKDVPLEDIPQSPSIYTRSLSRRLSTQRHYLAFERSTMSTFGNVFVCPLQS